MIKWVAMCKNRRQTPVALYCQVYISGVHFLEHFLQALYVQSLSFHNPIAPLNLLLLLLASERSERDTLRSVQLRIADILCIIYSTCNFCSYNP